MGGIIFLIILFCKIFFASEVWVFILIAYTPLMIIILVYNFLFHLSIIS